MHPQNVTLLENSSKRKVPVKRNSSQEGEKGK